MKRKTPKMSKEKIEMMGTVKEALKGTQFIVTLDNGHVWVQSETNSRARLAVGDTVTIKKGALASYLLITPSKVATRVKRVQ